MKYLNDISYKDCVGKVFKSTSSGNFKILKYNDKTNVEIEAFNAYKQAKEAHLKELAAKWKSQIDERAYLALINYEVHIDD